MFDIPHIDIIIIRRFLFCKRVYTVLVRCCFNLYGKGLVCVCSFFIHPRSEKGEKWIKRKRKEIDFQWENVMLEMYRVLGYIGESHMYFYYHVSI